MTEIYIKKSEALILYKYKRKHEVRFINGFQTTRKSFLLDIAEFLGTLTTLVNSKNGVPHTRLNATTSDFRVGKM